MAFKKVSSSAVRASAALLFAALLSAPSSSSPMAIEATVTVTEDARNALYDAYAAISSAPNELALSRRRLLQSDQSASARRRGGSVRYAR